MGVIRNCHILSCRKRGFLSHSSQRPTRRSLQFQRLCLFLDSMIVHGTALSGSSQVRLQQSNSADGHIRTRNWCIPNVVDDIISMIGGQDWSDDLWFSLLRRCGFGILQTKYLSHFEASQCTIYIHEFLAILDSAKLANIDSKLNRLEIEALSISVSPTRRQVKNN